MLLHLLAYVLSAFGAVSVGFGTDPWPGTWPPRAATTPDAGTDPPPDGWPPR